MTVIVVPTLLFWILIAVCVLSIAANLRRIHLWRRQQRNTEAQERCHKAGTKKCNVTPNSK